MKAQIVQKSYGKAGAVICDPDVLVADPEAMEQVQNQALPSPRPFERLDQWVLLGEFPIASALFIVASLNLAYRPIWLITVLSAVLLLTFRAYLKWRYEITIPFLALFLAFAAVGVDTTGNHFQLYQQLPWVVPYDVLAHLTIPAMLAPALVWLLQAWLEKLGYPLPLGLVTFFAIHINLSLASFYEITELWDDLYFGGRRIHGSYDTARDLQFDLLGAIFGSALTYLVLLWRARRTSPVVRRE